MKLDDIQVGTIYAVRLHPRRQCDLYLARVEKAKVRRQSVSRPQGKTHWAVQVIWLDGPYKLERDHILPQQVRYKVAEGKRIQV